MNKFCTSCGAAIKEGDVCACQGNPNPKVSMAQSQPVQGKEVELTIDSQAIVNYFSTLGTTCIQGVVKPITAGLHVVSKQNVGVSIGIMSVIAILISFLFLTVGLDAKYSFQYGILLTLGINVITFLMALAFSFILTKQVYAKKSLAIASAILFPLMTALLISIVAALIAPTLIFPVILAGIIGTNIAFYSHIKDTYNVSVDTTILLVSISVMITTIIIGLASKAILEHVISSIFSSFFSSLF